MATMAGVAWRAARNFIWSPTWMAKAQGIGPLPTALPGYYPGDWKWILEDIIQCSFGMLATGTARGGLTHNASM